VAAIVSDRRSPFRSVAAIVSDRRSPFRSVAAIVSDSGSRFRGRRRCCSTGGKRLLRALQASPTRRIRSDGRAGSDGETLADREVDPVERRNARTTEPPGDAASDRRACERWLVDDRHDHRATRSECYRGVSIAGRPARLRAATDGVCDRPERRCGRATIEGSRRGGRRDRWWRGRRRRGRRRRRLTAVVDAYERAGALAARRALLPRPRTWRRRGGRRRGRRWARGTAPARVSPGCLALAVAWLRCGAAGEGQRHDPERNDGSEDRSANQAVEHLSARISPTAGFERRGNRDRAWRMRGRDSN